MATHWRAPKLLTRIFLLRRCDHPDLCSPEFFRIYISSKRLLDRLAPQSTDPDLDDIVTCCFGLLNILVPARPGVVSRPCTENLNDHASMTRCSTDTRVKVRTGNVKVRRGHAI